MRYKCSTCPDFDVCQNCIEEVESTDSHPHTFLRIAKPLPQAHMKGAIPLLANRSHWIHSNVCCMQCPSSDSHKKAQRIVGFRFFCTVCGDSLCEHCEQTSGHDPSHPLLKMTPPNLVNPNLRK